jgi:hypothetical protein
VEVAGGHHVTMVGRVGDDYLVVTSDRGYENWRLRRVSRTGEQTRLAGGPASQPAAHLADGGGHVVLEGYRRGGSVLRVLDTTTGELVARRDFLYVQVLDVASRRMVIGQWQNGESRARTFWWNPFNDKTVRIAARAGYIADVSADRIGVFLDDPYLGGCQKVMTLSTPRELVWRSCDDAVMSFSPHARRMVTTHILSDGAGPRVVQVRGRRGRVLDTYHAQWFGVMHWENDRRLLLQAAGPRAVAMTRCTLRRCERISRLHPTRDGEPWSSMPLWMFAPESLLDR